MDITQEQQRLKEQQKLLKDIQEKEKIVLDRKKSLKRAEQARNNLITKYLELISPKQNEEKTDEFN
ncbi:hypothetical protein [Sulfurospirillum arcachonense]|uniref:hypothetical protein n=1 Tax=Sulfurospirillum arcachonense TaxID=57666 RepID=UPI0004682D9E|nr:hypothetical protein [Sulfurospirillum arcachonense]